MTDGVVVFAYNFPHRKTQDVLLCLRAANIEVAAVLAADRVDTGVAPSSVRTRTRGGWTAHPDQVARALGIRFHVMPHRGPEIERFLHGLQPSLGVIAGARILSSDVIDRFSIGVLNLHPGLVPEVRGLDSLLWAVQTDQPLGVTAHLIDERVDAGRVILRREIGIVPDDSVFDLSERLYGAQLEILPAAIELARAGSWVALGDLPPSLGKMPPELEDETLRRVPGYVVRFAGP